MHSLAWRVMVGGASATLLIGTGAAAAGPAAAARLTAGPLATVTCPTVDPATGAVTPAPANGVDWSGCDLTGANLADASLKNADLADATLLDAILTGASIGGTQLTGANLYGVRSGSLTGTAATLPSGYTVKDGYLLGLGVNLNGLNLTKVPLDGAQLSYATFVKSDLAGITLTGTQLSNADFDGADLQGAHLGSTSLADATLTSADLAGADLDHANLTKASFMKAGLAGANLTHANVSYAAFAGANLTGASLADANVTAATVAGATLAKVSSGGLGGAPTTLPSGWSVIGGYLAGPHANLSGANLAGAFGVNVSFASVTLTKAKLSNADLESADFAGANLTGASLAGADLTGAELTANSADLTGTTWSKATRCPDGQPASAVGCFAKPAEPAPPAVTVTVRRGAPGTVLTITGKGYARNEPLTIDFGATNATKLTAAKTTAAGTFGPVTITIPAAAQPGLHQLTATGKPAGQTAAAWFTVATDWDQAGFGSSLTSFNPTENTITQAKAATLKEKFSFNAQHSPDGAFTPTIADGVAYVAAFDGPLNAVNATTGNRLWTWTEPFTWDDIDANPDYQLSQPAVEGGTVYLSVASEGIVAIGPGGKLLWQTQTIVPSSENATILSEPSLANGVLYATSGSVVFAFSAASGAQLWYAEPAPWPATEPEACGEPAVSGGVLYLACGDGYVYALSATTGRTLWYYEVPGTPVLTTAVVSGGTVYVTTNFADDELYAISTTTHAQLWSFTAGDIIHIPAVAGNIVYLVSEDGVLHALNASSGAQLWSAILNPASDALNPYDVSVADGVVYAVSVNEVVCAFSAATGKQLWHFQAGNTLQTTPVIANGIVYLGTGNGGVEAFAPN